MHLDFHEIYFRKCLKLERCPEQFLRNIPSCQILKPIFIKILCPKVLICPHILELVEDIFLIFKCSEGRKDHLTERYRSNETAHLD